MTRKRESRRAELRAADVDGRPGVTLRVITPGVVDDFGTVWMADVFDEFLRSGGQPVLCWVHDWAEPLGPMVGYRTGAEGPELDFAFSDFEAVPAARRAHAQVSDGTIRDCSVGFARLEWREATESDKQQWPGAREVITKSGLDEVSLVLRGAVPGAKVLAFRSAGGTVDADAVVELARRVMAGELSAEEAKVAVELLGEDGDPDGAAGSDDDPEQNPDGLPPGDGEPDLDVEIADALDVALGRFARR